MLQYAANCKLKDHEKRQGSNIPVLIFAFYQLLDKRRVRLNLLGRKESLWAELVLQKDERCEMWVKDRKGV